MPTIAGFLQIDDPVNGCAVLVDNYMTAQLAADDDSCKWRIEDECPECQCEHASCGVTSIFDAPWYDEHQPGSTEFFGLYGALSISQPPATTTVTASGTTSAAPLKQLTFTGAVIACTSRGAQFGHRWVAKQLEPLCGSCDGRQATVNLWCPDELCDFEFADLQGEPTPIEIDWSAVSGLDGCTEAEPLGPTPEPADSYDVGARNIIDIEYVPGSYQDLSDEIPTCHGVRVTFSFIIKTGDLFLPPNEVCVLRAPGEGEPQPCCAPLSFAMGDSAGECGCPTRCECEIAAVSSEDSGQFGVLADGAAECRYSTPLCSKTFACLTSTFSTENAVPTITIETGSAPLENVSITIWEAVHGLPNPSTARGFEIYQGRAPVADPALIGWIPAQTTLTLDGRNNREFMVCPGGSGEPQVADVVRCGYRRYRHPTLCCGRRYWVAVEVDCDCDHPGDWVMRTELAGIDRV